MKIKPIFLYLFFSCLYHTIAQTTSTDILILGSDHLSQVYNEEFPNTDVLQAENQNQLQEFSALIEAFNPDVIMVEKLPEEQDEIDSLYNAYKAGKINIDTLENGRSEVYQLGFRIGKDLNIDNIVAVNAPGGTSQSILDNGENIELYENATTELRKVVSTYYRMLQNGELSLKDYLVFLNQPETYNLIYHLRYMTPARVINGSFTNPDKMVDTAFIDKKYIGAELISIFKNRDYKIYSNIVTNQLRNKHERILLIIGVAHIGSIKSILTDDSAFSIIEANTYLKR